MARGIAYYTGIVFELLDGNSGLSLGGGGRYDGLARNMGSPRDVPALGFAYDLDRLLHGIALASLDPNSATKPRRLLVVPTAPDAYDAALRQGQALREEGRGLELKWRSAAVTRNRPPPTPPPAASILLSSSPQPAKGRSCPLTPSSNGLRFVLPSDGALYTSTLDFLSACNLKVRRHSARKYTGVIPSLPATTVLFQRTGDVTSKVEDGSADVGITGLDRFLEGRREAGSGIVVIPDLGFGQCELVLAVPSAWLDVTTLSDLADLALEFRRKGRRLRIATKYPNLVQRFLLENGINYFTLVLAGGTIEAAPAANFADVIADLTSSGETLKENRLRPLEDGSILVSQACLIANRVTISKSARALEELRRILEMLEGYLQARSHYRLSANIRAESAEEIASRVLAQPHLAGLRGPTVSKMYNVAGEGWYTVNVVVEQDNLLEMIDHLRSVGAADISTSGVGYMFKERCFTYENLLSQLTD